MRSCGCGCGYTHILLAAACCLLVASIPFAIADDPIVRATPSVLSRNGDSVTISWSVSDPHEFDKIVIRSPSTSPVDIFYHHITVCPAWKSGNCSLALRLVNMRTDYAFVYMTEHKRVVAQSNAVTFANPNEPLEGHIQLNEDSSGLWVHWTTRDNLGDSQVQMGTSPGLYDSYVKPAQVDTYAASQMVSEAAELGFRDPGHLYTVHLDGLKPGVQYFYRYGSPTAGFSAEYSFTGPSVGQNYPFRMSFIADMGTDGGYPHNYPQAPVTASGVADDVYGSSNFGAHMVLDVGDISYARGWGYIWSLFHDMIENIAVRVPWQVAIGNHELLFKGHNWEPGWRNSYGDDSGGELGIPYSARFGFAPFTSRPHWYSFNNGPLHVAMLSSEEDFVAGSAQYNWFVNDIKSVNREVTPWVFMAIHRPFYDVSVKDPLDETLKHLRETYENFLVANKVDMVLSGHVHCYERTCPMSNGECVADGEGPVYAVSGSAGESHHAPFNPLINKWSKFHTLDYGRSRMTIANSTHLLYEWVANADGKVKDEFWVIRKP
eukprot:ANDGO_07896.mRNA.1 putative inactive purple acid phosphatase 9